MAGQLNIGGAPFATPAVTSPMGGHHHHTLGDQDDRRQCFRRPLHCAMLLIEGDGRDERDTVPGECLNVSDGGLYGTVPLGYGVAIGQRYTFRLVVGERGPEPGATQLVSQQGVVLRTELLVGRGDAPDRLGIAVRLTGHRSGMIPMPSWT
jgi:hypothetical protein